MKIKISILLLIFSFVSSNVFSQISEGGVPPSFKLTSTRSTSSSRIKEYKVEANKKQINKLLREEAFNISQTKPSPIATVLPVDYNLTEDGDWTTIQDDIRICRLKINAPDALGIILTYSNFFIPEGNKLFIYNKDKSQVLGAYTNITNPDGGSFSTEIVYGDELTLEYVEYNNIPANIRISSVGYGYQGIVNYTKLADEPEGFNRASYCQVNINCTEGADWQTEKRSVTRIYALIGSIWYRSTGSLINNTSNDKDPLLLTAAHCIKDRGIIADMSSIQFYFNYEFSGCVNEKKVPEGYKTMVGANILVLTPLQGGSDGALLRLNDHIPDDYDVYFNGWDISEQISKSGVVIHHPSGDVKKISTYNTPIRSNTYTDSDGAAMNNAHWAVQYTETLNGFGSTEKGSSGSPLFNQEKLVIGTLTGGNTSCSNTSGTDYYGKLSYHWDKNISEVHYMKPFLDPINANVKKMYGLANIDGKPIDPTQPDESARDAFSFWSEYNSDILKIRLKDKTDYIKHISISNLAGYNVYRNPDVKFEGNVDRSYSIPTIGWTNGIYIIQLETTKNIKYSFKIIK